MTMAKAKPQAKAPPAAEKARPAAKVAFPKKAQPPTHAEFAARLPAPVGKRFDVLRTFLKKHGAAEDFFFYALDAHSGAIRWKYQTNLGIVSSPAVSNDLAVVEDFVASGTMRP